MFVYSFQAVRRLFAREGPSFALKGQNQGPPLVVNDVKILENPFIRKKLSNLLASVASAKIFGFSMKMPLISIKSGAVLAWEGPPAPLAASLRTGLRFTKQIFVVSAN